jgi:hypothetical protein
MAYTLYTSLTLRHDGMVGPGLRERIVDADSSTNTTPLSYYPLPLPKLHISSQQTSGCGDADGTVYGGDMIFPIQHAVTDRLSTRHGVLSWGVEVG